jgi:hypothetical protein
MNPWKIIFEILMVSILACLALGSNIPCLTCGQNAYEVRRKGIPNIGICLFPLPEGGNCQAMRSQKYYKCHNEECNTIIVKNKRIQNDSKEGCEHDNRHIFGRLPTLGASSSVPAVRREVLPSGNTLYHFLDDQPPLK